MTVVTKPLTGEKKPQDQATPLVVEDAQAVDVEKGTGVPNSQMGLKYGQHFILRSRVTRVSTAYSLCWILTSIMVMTVGIMGGLSIYNLLKQPAVPHRGFCKIPRQGFGSPIFTVPVDEPQNQKLIQDMYFQESYELDTNEERYSELEVPDFENGREGRFIHEFDSNQTAIVDINAKRCFIMPLDRERIMKPTSLLDLFIKMQQGAFNLDTTVIRKTMRVNPTPVKDMSNVGAYIRNKCADKTIYMLEKYTSGVVKRDTERVSAEEKPFVEFSGTALLAYDIVNLHELENPKPISSK